MFIVVYILSGISLSGVFLILFFVIIGIGLSFDIISLALDIKKGTIYESSDETGILREPDSEEMQHIKKTARKILRSQYEVLGMFFFGIFALIFALLLTRHIFVLIILIVFILSLCIFGKRTRAMKESLEGSTMVADVQILRKYTKRSGTGSSNKTYYYLEAEFKNDGYSQLHSIRCYPDDYHFFEEGDKILVARFTHNGNNVYRIVK